VNLKLGGEEKNPKSWGNGYFRLTIMDMIKLGGGVVAITIFVLGIQTLAKKVGNISTLQYSTIKYIKNNIPTKGDVDFIYVQQGKRFDRIAIRIKRLEGKKGTDEQVDHIDIPNWDYRLPADWLDSKASGE
jgi:hypothetical protein